MLGAVLRNFDGGVAEREGFVADAVELVAEDERQLLVGRCQEILERNAGRGLFDGYDGVALLLQF